MKGKILFLAGLTAATQAYSATNMLSGSIDVKETENTFIQGDHHRLSRRDLLLDPSCDNYQRKILMAMVDCTHLAQNAARAAANNSPKLLEFFKSNSPATIGTVVEVFNKAANSCKSIMPNKYLKGVVCIDGKDKACEDGTGALTNGRLGYVGLCPPFWQLPQTSTRCHTHDKGNVFLHEVTHIDTVKGTDDYIGVLRRRLDIGDDGFGYEFIRQLPANMNINHADTYALFAAAIYASKYGPC